MNRLNSFSMLLALTLNIFANYANAMIPEAIGNLKSELQPNVVPIYTVKLHDNFYIANEIIIYVVNENIIVEHSKIYQKKTDPKCYNIKINFEVLDKKSGKILSNGHNIDENTSIILANNELKLLDQKNKKVKRSLKNVKYFVLEKDRKAIQVFKYNESVRILDFDGNVLKTFKETSFIYLMKQFKNIILTGSDSTINIFDIKNNRLLKTYNNVDYFYECPNKTIVLSFCKKNSKNIKKIIIDLKNLKGSPDDFISENDEKDYKIYKKIKLKN